MMSQSSNPALYCEVCYPTSQEVVQILYNLKSLISKGSQTIVEPKSNKLEALEDKYSGSVEKLIKFIFNQKLPVGFPLKKTKMSLKQINQHCDTIYQFQAKRNYQIQVLVNQVKCFPKTIIDDIAKKNKQISSKPQRQQVRVKVQSANIISNQLKDSPSLQLESQNQISPPPNVPCYYYPYYFPTIQTNPYIQYFNSIQ